jgi:hypothetical protein
MAAGPHVRNSRSAPALLALTLWATPAFAQQQDKQLWLQLNANLPLSENDRLTVEQIERFGDRQGGLFQTEFGVLVSHRLNKQIEIAAGYRRVGSHNDNSANDEDRWRQQMIGTFGRAMIRLRLDERFNPGGPEIGFRFRPLLRYNHPVGGHGTALFVSHESFFLPNSTNWGQRRGYERMRNIVGVSLPILSGIGADIGYLNQYRFARGGGRAQMDHALTLQLTISIKRPRTVHPGD